MASPPVSVSVSVPVSVSLLNSSRRSGKLYRIEMNRTRNAPARDAKWAEVQGDWGDGGLLYASSTSTEEWCWFEPVMQRRLFSDVSWGPPGVSRWPWNRVVWTWRIRLLSSVLKQKCVSAKWLISVRDYD